MNVSQIQKMKKKQSTWRTGNMRFECVFSSFLCFVSSRLQAVYWIILWHATITLFSSFLCAPNTLASINVINFMYNMTHWQKKCVCLKSRRASRRGWDTRWQMKKNNCILRRGDYIFLLLRAIFLVPSSDESWASVTVSSRFPARHLHMLLGYVLCPHHNEAVIHTRNKGLSFDELQESLEDFEKTVSADINQRGFARYVWFFEMWFWVLLFGTFALSWHSAWTVLLLQPMFIHSSVSSQSYVCFD